MFYTRLFSALAGRAPISLAAVADLMVLKERTGRAQDAADVAQLRKLNASAG